MAYVEEGTFRDVRSQLGQVESPCWESRGTGLGLGQGCLISDQDHTEQTVGKEMRLHAEQRPLRRGHQDI